MLHLLSASSLCGFIILVFTQQDQPESTSNYSFLKKSAFNIKKKKKKKVTLSVLAENAEIILILWKVVVYISVLSG